MATWEITTANNGLEYDTAYGIYNSCWQIDSNHFINFYAGTDTDGFTQIFTVNTTTWAVTTASASLEFDTVAGQHHSCYKVDTNHFINFWGGNGADGFVQVFTVNTTTWEVTTSNSYLEFDTQNSTWNNCYQIDANHFINFWLGGATTTDGFTQVFTVDTTTWAVTTAGSSLVFDTDVGTTSSCYQIDANHFINFWTGVGDDGFVQVFTVNTTTWAVTTASAVLEFDTQNNLYNSCCRVDTNHFINFWTGLDSDGYTQIFTVNTTTWAVTTANATLEFDTVLGNFNSCFQIDSTHVINFWAGSGNDGFVQIFTVNTTTWAVTTSAARLEFDTNNGQYNSCYPIDSNHFINFYAGLDQDAYVNVVTIELSASGPANLKTYNTNAKANIKTINTNPIANVKTLNTNA